MAHRITILPQAQTVLAAEGETLLSVLRRAGRIVDAPCGGDGRCGKCRVRIGGEEVLACQTPVCRDMTVTLPEENTPKILMGDSAPRETGAPAREGYFLAFDIGTTTVVGYLLDGITGTVLAQASMGNPQVAFGADVVTRIRLAQQGQMAALVNGIRTGLQTLTQTLCRDGKILPGQIRRVSVVGNSAMQQIFLGIPVDNLAAVPFAPVLTQAKSLPAGEILPIWENAELLILPDIAGFVGADTVACILATGMHTGQTMTLLVDIGTNGEMVLGSKQGMTACSAAAGPALEGACIRFGMRGQTGAIDHVWLENGQVRCSVIGGGAARGICGSGLIDAVAVALDCGLLNERGKLLTEDGLLHLTEDIFLTQEDIRQVQLAKGAIAAGIRLMAAHRKISLQEIGNVYLAGAFGTYMNPRSACRIGLLPKELEDRITAVGNAAGSGAKEFACRADALALARQIAAQTEPLELAALPEFPRIFAKSMRF